MEKEEIKFNKVIFHNRWNVSKRLRSERWLIFGLYSWWASPVSLCYKVGVFGFDWIFMFERIKQGSIK